MPAMTIRTVSGMVGSLFAALVFGWWLSDFIMPSPAVLTSTADAACKSKWVKNAQNDPALLCYLQTQRARLCNPAEKQHLKQLFAQYLKQKDQFASDINDLQNLPKQAAAKNTTEVALVLKASSDMMNGGGSFSSLANGTQSADPMEDPKLQAAMQKINNSYNAEMNRLKTPALVAALAVPQVPRLQLVAAIKILGEYGYIEKSDFGWFPDVLIADGFAEVNAVLPKCQTAN
jgi:hypothetical protein